MVLDSRRRFGLALENLEVRDLEGMAWHSLQLMIEQQPGGNTLASLIREILGGLPSCSKSAAKSRLQLAQQALDHHGCKLPDSFMPEVVQLMLAYIQAQYNTVHTEELAKLSGLTMEALLPMVVGTMQNPSAAAAAATAAPASMSAQLAEMTAAGARAGAGRFGSGGGVLARRGLKQGAVGGLASAGGLMTGMLQPVLKMACKGTERNTMSAACVMLEHLLAPFSSYLHVRDIMAAARLCLTALISMLPSMGPLERHVAGVFAPLQQAVVLLGISIDTDLQRQAFSVCVRGAMAADDWHMRHAAVQALGRMALAVQVPDPLLACCVEQGLQEYPRSCPQPLVVTPAVAQMCKMKGEAAQVLGTARHDRVGCVRQAATSSLEALAGLPGINDESAGSQDFDVVPKDQSSRDQQQKVSKRQRSPYLCGTNLVAPLPDAPAATPAAAASHLKQQQQHLQRKQQQRRLLQEEQQLDAAREQELQQQEEEREEQRQQLLLLQQERLARRQHERQQQAERQQQQAELQQQQVLVQQLAEQQQRERQQQEQAWELLQAELRQQQQQIARQRAEQQQQRERQQQEQAWELQVARTQQLLEAFHKQSTLFDSPALRDDSSEELNRGGIQQRGGRSARATEERCISALYEDRNGETQEPTPRLGVGIDSNAADATHTSHTITPSQPLQQATTCSDLYTSLPQAANIPGMRVSPPSDAFVHGNDYGGSGAQDSTLQELSFAHHPLATTSNHAPAPSPPASTVIHPYPSGPRTHSAVPSQAALASPSSHSPAVAGADPPHNLSWPTPPKHSATHTQAQEHPHDRNRGLDLGPGHAHNRSALPNIACNSNEHTDSAHISQTRRAYSAPRARPSQQAGAPGNALALLPFAADPSTSSRPTSPAPAMRDPSHAMRDPSHAMRDPSPLSPRAAARSAELTSRPRWNAHQVKHNPQAAQQAWEMELLMGGGGGGGRGGLRAWMAGLGAERCNKRAAHSVSKNAHLPAQARRAGAGQAAQPHATLDPLPMPSASMYVARRAELAQQQRERQQQARQQQQQQGHVRVRLRPACLPQQQRQQQQRQQEGKAVRPFWRGSGGGGGAAAAYAACRERHDYLVADRLRISLHWGHSPRYDHIGPTFQRPDYDDHTEDLDFGIQVFAKPPPMRPVATYTAQPTSISLSPVAEVGESGHDADPQQYRHLGSPEQPASLHHQQRHPHHQHSEQAGHVPYLPPMHELPFEPPSIPRSRHSSPVRGMQQQPSEHTNTHAQAPHQAEFSTGAQATSPGSQHEVHIHIHPLLTSSSPQDSPPHAHAHEHHLHPQQYGADVLHQQATPFSPDPIHCPPSPFQEDSPTKHSPALHPPPHHQHPFPHATHSFPAHQNLGTGAHAVISAAASPSRHATLDHTSTSRHPARTIDFPPLLSTAALQPPMGGPQQHQQCLGMGVGAQHGGSANGARGPRKQWQVAEEQGSSRATTALRDDSLSGLSPTSPLSPEKEPLAASSPTPRDPSLRPPMPPNAGQLPSHHVVLGDWDGAQDPVPHPIPLGPLPSPLAPHSLQEMRTSVGGLVQSNTDALADLEGMLQRLSRVQLHLKRTRAAHSPLRASAPASGKYGAAPGSAAAGAAMLAESVPSMASLRQLRARINSVLGHSNEGGGVALEGEEHKARGELGSCISRRERYDSPERVDDRGGRCRPTDASPQVQAKLALLTSPITAPMAPITAPNAASIAASISAPTAAAAGPHGENMSVPGATAGPAAEAATTRAKGYVPGQGRGQASKSPMCGQRYCSPRRTDLGSPSPALEFALTKLASPQQPPKQASLMQASNQALDEVPSPRQPPEQIFPRQAHDQAFADHSQPQQPHKQASPRSTLGQEHAGVGVAQLQQAREHDLAGQAPMAGLEGDAAGPHHDRHKQQRPGVNQTVGDHDVESTSLPSPEGDTAGRQLQQQQPEQQQLQRSSFAFQTTSGAMHPQDQRQGMFAQVPTPHAVTAAANAAAPSFLAKQQGGAHPGQPAEGRAQVLEQQQQLQQQQQQHEEQNLPGQQETQQQQQQQQQQHEERYLQEQQKTQQQQQQQQQHRNKQYLREQEVTQKEIQQQQQQQQLPLLQLQPPRTHHLHDRPAQQHGQALKKQRSGIEAFAARTLAADEDSDTSSGSSPPAHTSSNWQAARQAHREMEQQQRHGFGTFSPAGAAGAASGTAGVTAGVTGTAAGEAGVRGTPAERAAAAAARARARVSEARCAAAARATLSNKDDEDSDASSKEKGEQAGKDQQRRQAFVRPLLGHKGVAGGGDGGGSGMEPSVREAAARAAAAAVKARAAAVARAALDEEDDSDRDGALAALDEEDDSDRDDSDRAVARAALDEEDDSDRDGAGRAAKQKLEGLQNKGRSAPAPAPAGADAAAVEEAAVKARAAAAARAALDEDDDSDHDAGERAAKQALEELQNKGRSAPAPAPAGADAEAAEVAAVKARAAAAAHAALDDEEDDSDRDKAEDGSHTPEKPHSSKPGERAAPDTPDASSWIARMRQRYNI